MVAAMNMEAAIAEYLARGKSITVLPPGIAAHGWVPGLTVDNRNFVSKAHAPLMPDQTPAHLEKRNAAIAEHARSKYPDIVALHRNGHCQADICKRLKVGKDTVRRAIKWARDQREAKQ